MNLFSLRIAGLLLLSFGIALFYTLSFLLFHTSTSFVNQLGRQQQQHKEKHKTSSVSKVVILVSQPRSGSTFLGKFINGIESMFYLYEPLRALLKLKDFNGKSTVYMSKARLFLQQLMDCQFTHATEKTLSDIYRGFFRRDAANICKKLTIENIHLCDEPRTNLFNHLCSRYKTLFVKFLEPRLPVDLSKLIEMASNANFRIVYLVRDPRASFWSLLSKGWVSSEYNDPFKEYVAIRCKEMFSNLSELKRLNNDLIKRKIMVLRYEDVIQEPLQIIRILSNFLNKDISDYHIKQFMSKIKRNVYCQEDERQDKGKARPNWYSDAGQDFIELIQRRCEAVMNLTGYRFRQMQTVNAKCNGQLVAERESVDLINQFANEYDDELVLDARI